MMFVVHDRVPLLGQFAGQVGVEDRAAPADDQPWVKTRSPAAVNRLAMSQKRTTIVVSAQPASSKWCWSGAILNTRLPVSLKEPTWISTDSATITNSPPSRTSSSSVLVTITRPASAPPRASEPVSPMKILAGGAFH